MSTVHNPSNFKPEDYVVVEYLDNRPPDYWGQPIEVWHQERDYWAREMRGVLGPDWNRKVHHCCHCGNGNVRYIVACHHGPSDEVVVFGDICVDRLGFENREQWKAQELRAKAAVNHARLRDYQRYLDYLEAFPEVKELVEEAEKPIHEKNEFVKDVMGKLKKYGSLSDKQVAAVKKALEQDYTWEQDKARWEAKQAQQRENSVWIGEIKKRQMMALRLVKVIEVDRPSYTPHDPGISFLHVFEDSETGSPVKWFASRRQQMTEGRLYGVKATVKKHDEWKGIKQTLVNRLVVVEEVD
jgi:hypothetical protein